MKIADRAIGPDQPPYIVAEIGANHGGDLSSALRMIDAAKVAGADAVKFQCYEADTITLDSERADFRIADGPWQGWRLYDLYRKCQTPFDWFPKIAERARALGITWFASAFDRSAVVLLDKLDVAAIKIASFELVDLPLIEYVARTRRPLILSTGMATDAEINEAITATRGNCAVLLHCVSGYPTPVGQANLRRITSMKTYYGPHVGISDHTTGIEVPIAATVLGARMIEKHFTMNRRRATPDATFSMEPLEFEHMVDSVRKTWAAMQISPTESEDASRPLRRSLYAVEDIAAGETFTMENVRSIRPGNGLAPKMLDAVLGKTAARDISRGTALAWEMVAE